MILRGAWVAAALAAFFAYLQLAYTIGVSADAASNALQSWDMLHGNPLLSGWTTTDVSFYTNELILFMLVELVIGFRGEVVNAGVALTLVLVVLVTAFAARGKATGRAAFWRVLLAVAVAGVPAVGLGVSVQLNSPNHTGTAIPLLLTWIVLDRARPGARWLPWVIAVLLGLGQLSDPLVMYIGALPLMVVSGWRMIRERRFRGLNLWLAVAGIGSAFISQGLQLAIRAAGGWAAHPPTVEFASFGAIGRNAWYAVQGLAGNFGALFPDRHGPWGMLLGTVHLVGLLAAVVTTMIVLWRGLTRKPGEPGDRLAELCAVGIGINIAAYVVSTLPVDLGTARHIVAAVPLSAVLIARVWGDRLAAARPGFRWAVTGAAVLLAVELATSAITAQKSPHARDLVRYLQAQGLSYGIGSYWFANNVTLMTSGRVHVAPVTGGDQIRGYRSESRVDWYDPELHDARFVVLDKQIPGYGSEDVAVAQFGEPVARYEGESVIVLVYDHNLLVGLPAYCIPGNAPSMAECPPHRLPLFG